MKIFTTIVSLGLFVCMAAPHSAIAQSLPDPTGVWTGKASCKGLDDGQSFKVKGDATLELTFDDPLNNLSGTLDIASAIYIEGCGFVAAPTGISNKGRAIIRGFDSDYPTEHFSTVNVTNLKVYPEKHGISGKLKATIAVGDELGQQILSCKMSAKRTSLTDPDVGVLCLIN